MGKPKVAVHKFSSCDGCQLALLNLGEPLLQVAQAVEIVHFLEAGASDPDAKVDIAFVEGSISTHEEAERIQQVRANSAYLVTIGACATSGGLQGLRNLNDSEAQWTEAIYAQPQFIDSLKHASPIRDHVKVDLELWGCPINTRQMLAAVAALLHGVPPVIDNDKLCMDCKRKQVVCTMVTKQEPCMGPVTHTGCGALCPSFGRDCYACYGPSENPNGAALAQRFAGFGLLPEQVARRFLFVHSQAGPFHETGTTVYPEGLYRSDD